MSDMKLTDLPQEAVDAINRHKHNEDGKRIPTDGIENLAITGDKIAAGAITTEKLAKDAVVGNNVANGSLGAEKFKPGVLATVDMTSANVSFKNYIANGLKLDWNSGLDLIVKKGRANINDIFVDLQNDVTLPIPANSHGLGYLNKDGVLGFAPFKYPTIDSNFIFAYNFNDADPKTKVTDLTGNGYDLVGDGTLTEIISEPGHIGMGCSTGPNANLKSTKTVNIPRASAFTLIYAFIEKQISGVKIPICVGNSNHSYHHIYSDGTLRPCWSNGGAIRDETVTLARTVKNKLNVLIMDFDGYYCRYFLNGRMILKYKNTTTSTAAITGPIFVGNYYTGSFRGTGRSIHCFAGMTKTVYTQKQIADMCSVMGVANQYDSPSAFVPSMIGETAENHIWAMDETTGNTIGDTGTKFVNALQGIATNVDRAQSEIGLGIKRIFNNGSGAKIVLGNYKFVNEFSFFAVVEAKSFQSENYVLGSYNGTNGNTFRINENGFVTAWSGVNTTWYTGTRKFPINKIAIIGYVVDSDGIKIYSDTIHGELISGYVPDMVNNNSLSIGYVGGGRTNTTCFDGDIHHAFLIHRKLTPLEIKQFFNSVNNKTLKEMKDIVIPTDSVSLGSIKSNVSKLVDISTLPKYGVYKEPFSHGNKFFTGFKYFGLGQMVEMENPFGTTRIKVTAFKKQKPWEEAMLKNDWYFRDSYVSQYSGMRWEQCTNDILRFGLGGTNVSYLSAESDGDNSYGWFGFLVEKLDNAVADENDLMFQIDV